MSEDAGDLLEEWYRDYAGRVMAYLLHRTDYARTLAWRAAFAGSPALTAIMPS